MTENAPEITEQDLRAAEAAEQVALDENQKKHLLNRVVLLRVNLDKAREQLALAKAEVKALKERLEPDDEPDSRDDGDPESTVMEDPSDD